MKTLAISFQSLHDRLPRLTGWLFVAFLLALAVLVTEPRQIPLSLYKLSLVALAGVVGYWLDRSLFPYARPDFFLALERDPVAVDQAERAGDDGLLIDATPCPVLSRLAAAAMVRRAIIVAATMLAMGLGA